ncbi:MAG TPA: sigma-70 family RNA polymerase sigma factor [Pyrinomonadaceae bacterium]|nr:sigma-70 family RNA polymerase sigma factor [Pyrinomonadaceae bacterium]
MSFAEKHKKTIEESIVWLIARALNSRGLEIVDLYERVEKSIEKYVLRENENASSHEIKEFIDTLAADDLCLIIACEKADEKAWEDLVKNYDSTVKSAARKVSKNPEDAEDLASSIWAELYGLKEKDGKAKGKLSYYSGRGSLGGWLRAVVSQLAIDGFRKAAKFVHVEDAREFENLAQNSSENSDNMKVVHRSENPEEAFSSNQTQKDVSNALKKAISALEAEDKLILKLYYFDDLNLKSIGAAMGFHEATASRKIARLHTEIRKSVEKILISEHGWTKEEVKRYLTEAASKLDVGLERMFALLLCTAVVQEFWNAGVL